MKKREIVRKQLDDKLLVFQNADSVVPPASGWVYALRFALNMSLRQLGQRLSITPQSVKEIEEREKNGTISLRVLRQVASALNMEFFYGFIPKDRTIEAMIEKRAFELAEKAQELKTELPKLLWD
jgi:predicted DNA-binding mobile mystery protein A